VGNYLLDTHTALWFFSNHVCISIASVCELAIKVSIGKLKFSGNSAGFVRLALDSDILVMPIEPSYLTVLESLPFIHRDPFDRILIATAIVEKMTIITTDADIVRYDVPHVW